MSDFKIGDYVEKTGYHYSAGRLGKVIGIGQPGKPDRVHVHWLSEPGGFPIKWRGSVTTDGLKNWVSPELLKKV